MTIIKQFYREVYEFYQKDIKKAFLIITACFFLMILLGILYFYFNKELTINLMQALSEMINSKDIVDIQGNIQVWSLFRNNLQACTMAIGLGILPFLFLCFLPLIVNAVTVAIACAANLLSGASILFLIAALMPHGIFEIPAILLAITLGYYLCKELMMKMLGDHKDVSMIDVIRHILQAYIGLLLPLLLAAAFIESYLTPLMIQFVIS